MKYGSTKLTKYLYFFLTIMIIAPSFTYYMATIKQKIQPPFPHATITSTAHHYPQDIVFRYFMLLASSFLTLMFFVIYKWINYQCAKVGYHKRISIFSLLIVEASIALYGIAIGTIDGKGLGPLHGPSAVIVFLLWIYSLIRLSIFLTNLRNFDTTIMTRGSLLIKQIISVYAALIWIYCLTGLYLEPKQEVNEEDIYVVIVQWNSYICIVAWLLSFYKQWKHFGIGLFKKNNNFQMISLAN